MANHAGECAGPRDQAAIAVAIERLVDDNPGTGRLDRVSDTTVAAPAVRVSAVRPQHEVAYEQFVTSHPDALVFYTLGYRNLLREVLGCRPRYAIASQQGRIVGVLPLMETDGPYGTVLNSLPYFGSNGGPLVTGPDACEALVSWYHEQLYDGNISAGTLITNPLAPPSKLPDHDLVQVKIGHVTSLPADPREADLLRVLDKSRRWDIRKAERLGIRVSIDNDAIPTLRELHERSMSAIGAEAKAPAFFTALPKHFRAGADYDIFVARLDGAAIAALLVFYTGTSVDYFMPAVPPESRERQPLALILKTAMLYAVERGCERWNWGGSPSAHTTLQRFKAKWGGQPMEYRAWIRINDPAIYSASVDRLRSSYPGFFVVPYDSLGGA